MKQQAEVGVGRLLCEIRYLITPSQQSCHDLKPQTRKKKHMIFYPGFDWCCMEKHFSTEGMSIDGHQWEKSELVYTLQRSNIHAFCWKMVSSSVAFFKGWRITSTCLQKVINTTCNSLRIHKLKKSMFNECLSVWLRHG